MVDFASGISPWELPNTFDDLDVTNRIEDLEDERNELGVIISPDGEKELKALIDIREMFKTKTAFIKDSFFEQSLMELIMDEYGIDVSESPFKFIDWDKAVADEQEIGNYEAFDLNGVKYWAG